MAPELNPPNTRGERVADERKGEREGRVDNQGEERDGRVDNQGEEREGGRVGV